MSEPPIMAINGTNCTFFTRNINSTASASTNYVEKYDCTDFAFIFFTLIIGILILFGILGNLLSIVVLQRDRNNKVAVFLLQSLAIADTCVLVISLLVLSIIFALLPYTGRSEWKDVVVPYVVKYIHPVGYMAQCGTIWITVLLAVNRYIAIVRPFHAHKWCTLNKARIQVLIVLLSAVLLNTPRFFQYKLIETTSSVGNHTDITVTVYDTSIGELSLFGVIYTNIFYTVIVLLAPLAILTALNLLIIREIKYPKCSSDKESNCRRKSSIPPMPEEDNITFIMVIIIVVLIVCHTPDRIFQIYRYIVTSRSQLQCGQTLYYVSSVCNLLIVINSSSNFLIYYIVRRRFRKVLWKTVGAWCGFSRYKESPAFVKYKNDNTEHSVENMILTSTSKG